MSLIPQPTPDFLREAKAMSAEDKDILVGLLLRWWSTRNLNGSEDDVEAAQQKFGMYRAIARLWRGR